MIKVKIHRFLISIQNILLKKPDISIKTIRLFIDNFENCLSITEIKKESTKLLLRVIREIGIKQISIDTMNKQIITENLENELNNLKDKTSN